MTQQQEDKLWKVLTDCCKSNTEDLQSFTAKTPQGQVFVDCHDSCNVCIEHTFYSPIDKEEHKSINCFTKMASWTILKKLKIDVDTIEI